MITMSWQAAGVLICGGVAIAAFVMWGLKGSFVPRVEVYKNLRTTENCKTIVEGLGKQFEESNRRMKGLEENSNKAQTDRQTIIGTLSDISTEIKRMNDG